MAGTPQARPVQNDRVVQTPSDDQTGPIGFTWSHANIRVAGCILLGITTPAAIAFAISPPFARWLCLAWLAGIAALVHGLGRRASSDAAVVSVDQRGILDRRLMAR